MPSPVRLRLLGGFELQAPHASIPLPMSSQRVLAFLAVHEQTVRRPFVAGSLWPDVPDERAAASLRSALWRLPEPGCDLVESTGGGLRLTADVGVDVVRMVDLAHGLPQRPLADVVSHANHFEADLLPDWYDDWVIEWRERWRQIRLHALESITRILTAAGEFGRAIEAGLAAVRAEPLRETAHRALIGVHLAEGNTGEAVRQYRSYRRSLSDELGIEPSPEMQRLVEGLGNR